jgi:hypothetical protein
MSVPPEKVQFEGSHRVQVFSVGQAQFIVFAPDMEGRCRIVPVVSHVTVSTFSPALSERYPSSDVLEMVYELSVRGLGRRIAEGLMKAPITNEKDA